MAGLRLGELSKELRVAVPWCHLDNQRESTHKLKPKEEREASTEHLYTRSKRAHTIATHTFGEYAALRHAGGAGLDPRCRKI